jgi:hypothetical protein
MLKEPRLGVDSQGHATLARRAWRLAEWREVSLAVRAAIVGRSLKSGLRERRLGEIGTAQFC